MNSENPDNNPAKKISGKIVVTKPDLASSRFSIPREGFSLKGLFTLVVIVFWLLMIMVWTILLLQYAAIWALISIPFWLLVLITLRLSLKVMLSSQEIIVNSDEITIVKKESLKTSHITLKRDDIEAVAYVEGAFKSLSGITRKGIYPAAISNNEAFGFGERCTKEEKQFLLENIKSILKF